MTKLEDSQSIEDYVNRIINTANPKALVWTLIVNGLGLTNVSMSSAKLWIHDHELENSGMPIIADSIKTKLLQSRRIVKDVSENT